MLFAAKENKVKKFIYASSSVYGDDQSMPKAESKIGRLLSPYAVRYYIIPHEKERSGSTTKGK